MQLLFCKDQSPTALLNYLLKLHIYIYYESKWYTIFFSHKVLHYSCNAFLGMCNWCWWSSLHVHDTYMIHDTYNSKPDIKLVFSSVVCFFFSFFSFLSLFREFQEWLATLGQLVTLAGRCSNYANVLVVWFFLFVLFKSTRSNSSETTKNIMYWFKSYARVIILYLSSAHKSHWQSTECLNAVVHRTPCGSMCFNFIF